MLLNDVTPDKMEKGIYKKFSFFKDQVEVSPKTNKIILPISIKGDGQQDHFPKKAPRARRPSSKKVSTPPVSKSSSNTWRHAGDHPYGRILRHQHLRRRHPPAATPLRQPHRPRSHQLLQIHLMDTLMVDRQECVHLTFVPENPQDFGSRAPLRW